MQPILVPTDFSPTAYNAAQYAIGLAAQLQVSRIILYNAYQQYIAEDPMMMTVVAQDPMELKKISEEGLLQMFQTLSENTNNLPEVECVSDYNTITNGVLETCKKYGAGLVVMGITGANGKLDEAVIGSNAIDVSHRSQLPVIIVPSNAAFTSIKKVLLACDFKKVVETTPVAPVKQILDATHAELHVLHIESNGHDFTADTPFESLMLDELFRSYNPQYHFEKHDHFTDAINKFATENNIDLIITIPKKHGFFEGIFKRSHTKALAFHSHIPLMTIHD